jgi:hypothetical protein
VAHEEEATRTPVWFMRQGGLYMADFRMKTSFRERSETAEIAIELSLQPCSRGWCCRPTELLCFPIYSLRGGQGASECTGVGFDSTGRSGSIQKLLWCESLWIWKSIVLVQVVRGSVIGERTA